MSGTLVHNRTSALCPDLRDLKDVNILEILLNKLFVRLDA